MRAAAAIALTAALALAVRAQHDAPTAGMSCRSCHTADRPTKQNPALVHCPRAAMAGARSVGDAPLTILLASGSATYGAVSFPHRSHAEMTKSCAACHHNNEGRPITACASCHSTERAREDVGKPDAHAAVHRLCMDCHRRWSGANNCASCHDQKKAGARLVAVPQNRFHRALECAACHKAPDPYAKLNPDCDACHKGWKKKFDHKKTGLTLDPTHAAFDCENCHADKTFTGPPACGSCHERSYPKDVPGKRAEADVQGR